MLSVRRNKCQVSGMKNRNRDVRINNFCEFLDITYKYIWGQQKMKTKKLIKKMKPPMVYRDFDLYHE